MDAFKVERVLTHSLNTNVALTVSDPCLLMSEGCGGTYSRILNTDATQAVLSQLSVIPGSPQLNNKMFGRSTKSTTGSDENSTTLTLLDNLVNIWVEAQERVATIPEAVDKLTWVRKTMGVHDVATGVGSRVWLPSLVFEVSHS